MSNQIVIIDNVAVCLMLICLFGLSTCTLNQTNQLDRIGLYQNQSDLKQTNPPLKSSEIKLKTKLNATLLFVNKDQLNSLNQSSPTHHAPNNDALLYKDSTAINQTHEKSNKTYKNDYFDNSTIKITINSHLTSSSLPLINSSHPPDDLLYNTSYHSFYNASNSSLAYNVSNNRSDNTPAPASESRNSSSYNSSFTKFKIVHDRSKDQHQQQQLLHTTPIDRAKRSTTANYRLNYKTSKFKNYHNPSTITLSAKPHHHHLDNQFTVLNEVSLTKDLNNVEIAYSSSPITRFTTKFPFHRQTVADAVELKTTDPIDKLSTTDKFTSKPNISNTLSSLSLPNFDENKRLEFDDAYSSYPNTNGFFTNLYTKSSTNSGKKPNLFENTSTSLLPLLLFDRHQLAQEINFTTRNLSTEAPLEHRNHNSRTSSPFTANHHNSYTKSGGHHSSKYKHSTKHSDHTMKHSDHTMNHNLDHTLSNVFDTTLDYTVDQIVDHTIAQTVVAQDHNRHMKGKNVVHLKNNAKRNQSEDINKEKLPTTEMMRMNTIWPMMLDDERSTNNNQKIDVYNQRNRISLTTTPVPTDYWITPLINRTIEQHRSSSNLVNINYIFEPYNRSTISPFLTQYQNDNERDREVMNRNDKVPSEIGEFSNDKIAEKLGKKDDPIRDNFNYLLKNEEDFEKFTTRLDLMQNDEDSNKWPVTNEFTIAQFSPSNSPQDRHSKFNGTFSADLNPTNSTSILSPAIQNVVTVFLGIVIIITIIGNTLVCLSPIYFRKLRHPSNYLLISLALSDLGVALLVMPIALYKELHPVWSLGTLICDIFPGLDVVCCTASILHLCVICIDRYLTITRPFTYAVRRKSSRSMYLISIVWSLAIVVCLPPLLVLGNEHGTKDLPTCDYCNNFFYQLYATLGAFYIPLVVMLVLYYKIYEAAKKVIEAEHKSQCSNSVVSASQAKSSNPPKSFSDSSSLLKPVVNTCPAHPNSLTLSNESKFANNNVSAMNKHNVNKSIDHHRAPLKQSTLEKSSTTHCTACGRSLEHERELQTNKTNINNCLSNEQKAGNSREDLNELNKNGNLIKQHRKCLFTIRKSKSKENNSSINNLDDKCGEDNYGRNHSNTRSDHNEEEDESITDNSISNGSKKKSKEKRNRKFKRKSRTPDVRQQQSSSGVLTAHTSQPLLVDSASGKSRRKEPNLEQLEYIDGLEQEDRSNLCDQCINNLMINSNDSNNNLNKNEINDLNQSEQLVLECNAEHNTDHRYPTSLNCKFDANYDTNKFSQLNQFDHKTTLASSKDKDTDRKLKNRSINLNIAHQQISNTPSNKKLTHSSLRERKASITLGVIMCAFIFCWLPFFILALLRPFASQLIPDWASSLTLWLGYLNSMLNPLIYVTFHQDFRRAFKYILLCRCKVMKSSMRKEAYNVQYG